MAQQTAVEWFWIHLEDNISKKYFDLFQQAKEMEKQKQQKYNEMLEMLKKAERTLREVYQCDNKEIQQLIKSATEL